MFLSSVWPEWPQPLPVFTVFSLSLWVRLLQDISRTMWLWPFLLSFYLFPEVRKSLSVYLDHSCPLWKYSRPEERERKTKTSTGLQEGFNALMTWIKSAASQLLIWCFLMFHIVAHCRSSGSGVICWWFDTQLLLSTCLQSLLVGQNNFEL